MSVIQKIRDKYARWAVIAIAVSLIGFLLMDAFAGRTGLFSNKQSTTLGKIDGQTIDYADFSKKLSDQEAYEQKQGMEISDDRRQQLISGLWDQEVNQVVMDKQYKELGLSVGDKELKDILFGANPPEDLKQRFTDQKTGLFNSIAAQQFINSLKKTGSPDDKAQLDKYMEALRNQRLMSKYVAFLANTIYYPKWFLEKRNIDNSLMAGASYISIPYSTVPDSSVKVSDGEIEAYIKEHKKDFEQKDETRSISYVTFNAAPSSTDSAVVRNMLDSLKIKFIATNDPVGFIAQQGTTLPYDSIYYPKSRIQLPFKDTIFALPKGGVFGPYVDGNNYVLAKMVDSKISPDSAKAIHILIQTVNPQTGQVLLADSIAKKRIDSIKIAIDKGARFDSLAKKYSDDKGSGAKGGLLSTPTTDYFAEGQMVKNFNDFVFNGKKGDRNIVKTEFGYHLIEILDLKNIEPHYRIAQLGKPIAPSPETDNTANNQASLFAGDSRDQVAFNANFEKNLKGKGLNKLVANDIKPMDFSFSGLQGPGSRKFVKDIFDASKGDVIGPERIGYNYIVAIVTDVNKPGLTSISQARPKVEPLLRNKKKSGEVIKRLGQVTTLEQAAAKLIIQVQKQDSVRFNGGNNIIGYEPKVLGALFNPSNLKKVVGPIAGTQGVYMVRVDDIKTTPVENANIESQRKMMEMQARQMMQYRSPIEVLKKTAAIKDNRAKFF